MNVTEAQRELARLSALLDDGLENAKGFVIETAEAEHAYRKQKSIAWATCPNDKPGTKLADREWPAARREAWVDAEVADHKKSRDIAEGMSKVGPDRSAA